jgi:hypothetical protein
MKKLGTTLAVSAVVAAATVVACTTAEAFSKKVRDACSADFASLCSQYKPDSAQLRRCFQSNRKQLTSDCVSALVDAGEVPARYLKR